MVGDSNTRFARLALVLVLGLVTGAFAGAVAVALTVDWNKESQSILLEGTGWLGCRTPTSVTSTPTETMSVTPWVRRTAPTRSSGSCTGRSPRVGPSSGSGTDGLWFRTTPRHLLSRPSLAERAESTRRSQDQGTLDRVTLIVPVVLMRLAGQLPESPQLSRPMWKDRVLLGLMAMGRVVCPQK